jgi:hypothetical protein
MARKSKSARIRISPAKPVLKAKVLPVKERPNRFKELLTEAFLWTMYFITTRR